MDGWGSELASWTPFVAMMVIFGLIVVGLLVVGRGPFLERIPDGFERITGIPGWAGTSAGMAAYGLAVAGQGFFSDVAWHIALGRDKALFTAPHTSIVVGLGMIFLSAAVGIVGATVQDVPTELRLSRLRVPWSMIPLAVLGGSALAGFPLDELWHQEYGVDVTMWSPTHMLMILGASFTGPAMWLILAEAGVSPGSSRWARGALVLVGWLTFMGLGASLGEFEFGVPQFQQMFHPLVVTIVAAFALVVIRLVHGRGWALGIATGTIFVQTVLFGDDEPIPTRPGGIYVVSALVVELVALVAGTERRLRFALLSGLGVATFGLAGEWAWNQGARQPWHSTLLPDALGLCLLVGVGAAVVATALTSAAGAEAGAERALPGKPVVVLAGVAVIVGLALPMPRAVGDVTADIVLTPVAREPGDDGDPGEVEQVDVAVTLDPVDAAEDARWLQAISWQGGGLVIAEMEEVGPGEYRSDRPVPVTGRWKTLLRLHRGGEMMAAPIFLPDDPEIDEPEVPAEDRVVALSSEKEFLLRETVDGDAWFAYVIYGLLSAVALLWIVAFTLTAGHIGRSGRADRLPDPAG